MIHTDNSRNRWFASVIREAVALFAMARTLLLVVVVLGAGIVGGYVGGILAAIDLDQSRQASHSLGMAARETIRVNQPGGTFEQLGRVVDQFNAQFNENWRTWESLGVYAFSQGWAELKRVWSGPTARSSGTNDI